MAPPTEFPGHFDTTSLVTVICAALASYNALELILLIFTTFQAYHGLYFWSITVATCAIIPYVVGMEVMFFKPSAKLSGLIINNIGWIIMVVAQSVVLYSRLGIVLGKKNSKILVFTKWMIIVDAVAFYSLATAIVFGMQYSSRPSFDDGYIYVERIQMTGFCLQEFIISGLYIWKTLDILQAGEKRSANRTLWQLFVINILIVGLDIALLVLEYLSLAMIQISFKALAYSVKLKMEFAILNKLVESSSLAQRGFSQSFSNAVALKDDRDTECTQQPQISSQFVPVTGAQWCHKEEYAHFDHREHQSHTSIRTSSHQTDRSDLYLCQTGSSNTKYAPILKRVPSDPYHNMMKSISKAQ